MKEWDLLAIYYTWNSCGRNSPSIRKREAHITLIFLFHIGRTDSNWNKQSRYFMYMFVDFKLLKLCSSSHRWLKVIFAIIYSNRKNEKIEETEKLSTSSHLWHYVKGVINILPSITTSRFDEISIIETDYFICMCFTLSKKNEIFLVISLVKQCKW